MNARSTLTSLAIAAFAGLSLTLAAGCGSAPDEQTQQSDDALMNCRLNPDLCNNPPDPCTPITACPANINCGSVPNGCGGRLSCGACSAPTTCGGGGVAGQCGYQAPPPPPPDACDSSFFGSNPVAYALQTFPAVNGSYTGGGYSDPGGYRAGLWSTPAPTTAAPSTMSRFHNSQSGTACVPGSATDGVRKAQRTLIATYHCSQPVYWETFNDQGGPTAPDGFTPLCNSSSPWSCWADKANGWVQLCSDSSNAAGYVAGLGVLVDMHGQPSDMAAKMISADYSHAGPIPLPPPGYHWALTWQDPHACGTGGCMCAI